MVSIILTRVGSYVDAIMNSIISNRYTLSADDIAGAQRLYAQPPKIDMLTQNSSTGERFILTMCGTTQCSGVALGTFSTQWNIVASAFFGGSGNYWDIVWQNSSTGECLVWFMNETPYCAGCNEVLTHVGSAALPTLPPSWEIATAADFNGDGKADLLLQNMTTGQRVIWFMNGTTRTSSWSLGVVGTTWKITGSADFNRDGKADILWQNNNTGQRVIWFMNGGTRTGGWDWGIVPTAWDMVGTGDFNSDGKPDIVWQNQVTGEYAIWLMNGTTRVGVVSVGFLPTEWKIRNY
jgi:hypothetical protein